jgi:chromate transporter
MSEQNTNDQPADAPSFGTALRLWAKIGLLSFGGPAGQIAMMHKMLVEERRWIGEQRFLHALNYCMLLPGPEAQQLAVYIGWLLHRTAGGLAAGLLFILPGAAVMLALSIVYISYQHVPLLAGVFFGVKAVVLAVVVEAVLRIGRRALHNRALMGLAAGAFVALFAFNVPFPLIILAAALIGAVASQWRPQWFTGPSRKAGAEALESALIDRRYDAGLMGHTLPSVRRLIGVVAVGVPIWLLPLLVTWLALGSGAIWTQIAGFFSTMAVVTFGGAYAVLAYVAQASVEQFGWLAPGEMLDGLGLAETTPGPLILVLQFVGFLAAARHAGGLDPVLAGGLGGLLTLWVTFAPCFLWIFAGAPYVEAVRGNRKISAALAAITAAVVGVVLNLALWFGLHVVFAELRPSPLFWGVGPDLPVLASFDARAALLSAAALLAMLRWHWGMLPTLAAGAAVGALLTWLA